MKTLKEPVYCIGWLVVYTCQQFIASRWREGLVTIIVNMSARSRQHSEEYGGRLGYHRHYRRRWHAIGDAAGIVVTVLLPVGYHVGVG